MKHHPEVLGWQCILKHNINFIQGFLHMHQEALYPKEMFQNTHSKFLDCLDHLQNHPTLVEGSQEITTWVPISQNHSKRSVLSGVDEIVMLIFGVGGLGRYSQASSDKVKKNLHIMQQNQNMQN